MRRREEGGARAAGAARRVSRYRDAFLGRDTLLDEIEERLARGERLVTLLGPPGMGKTRVAHHLAQRAARRSELVWFCDLTEESSPAGLAASVARASGGAVLRGGASDHVAEALAMAGPLLLVLDNVEQLLPAGAATLIEGWCAVAPELSVIVTSRERLDVTGESVVELRPLELPAADGTADEDLRGAPAVALFLDRAKTARGEELDAVHLPDVASLVRELEGIPLAIELFAAMCRVQVPAELRARLARAGVLDAASKGGDRSRERHATLRSAIGGSWRALGDAERVALAQCAVFAGDFSFDAAESVVDLSWCTDAPSVLDVIASLCDRSLVRRVSSSVEGGTRLGLYVSIRDYASEQLAADERVSDDALRRRHRRYYLDTTAEDAHAVARAGDARARARLARESVNLLAAARWLLGRGTLDVEESADLARLVARLEPTLSVEWRSDDLLGLLSAGIAASLHAGDEPQRGRLLVARGAALGLRGETKRCLEDTEEAREIGRARGDVELEAEALMMAGVRYRQQGRTSEAWEAARAATSLLEGGHASRLLGSCLVTAGLLLGELGREAESRDYNARARAIFREAGDRWSEALAYANVAHLDQAAARYERAAHGYEEALARFREHGDRRYEGRYLGYLASLDHERGQAPSARAGYGAALERLAGSGMIHGEGLMLASLGALDASEGRARAAMSAFDQAEDLLARVEAPAFTSALEVHRGHLDLLFATLSSSGETPDPARAKQHLEAARLRLSEAKDVERSIDVRFAVRMLERALARHRPSTPPSPSSPAESLGVGSDGRWFQLGARPVVDLSRRGALRLLLLAFVARHTSAPGASMTWEELLAAGWPGEKVMAGAGATRVRVAVSTLRRLGLAGVLVTRDDGYLLTPRLEVTRGGDA